VGGSESLNGTAMEELSAVDIEYTAVLNPETGLNEERLTKGFYRQLHEAYYDLDFHKMGVSQLVQKVRSLEEQLASAKLEKDARLAPLLQRLPTPPALALERAVTHHGQSFKTWPVQTRPSNDFDARLKRQHGPKETTIDQRLPVLVLSRHLTVA